MHTDVPIRLIRRLASAGTLFTALSVMGLTPTVNGQDLKLTVNEGTVMVNEAKVVKADVLASNGVIHVIDTVLLPKN